MGYRDLQSPEEFLERLETFCIISGAPEEKRLTHVTLAVLEVSGKLWWHFVGGSTELDTFESATDPKWRLKDELEQSTCYPE